MIKTITGAITTPHHGGLKLILSTQNLNGKFDSSPMADALKTRWPKVKETSYSWFANKTGSYKLGAIENVAVQSDVWVIHMLCQKDATFDSKAVKDCVANVVKLANEEKASLHVDQRLLDSVVGLEDCLKEASNKLSVYKYTA